MSYFLIVIGAVVLLVGLGSSKPPTEEERIAQQADEKETSKRFKEAAERGLSPEEVVGFKCMEKFDILKNYSAYIIVKDVCMALAAKGYRFTAMCEDLVTEGRHIARVLVYDGEENLGYIKFIEKPKPYWYSSYLHHCEMKHMSKEGKSSGWEPDYVHRIEDASLCLFINSTVAPSEATPEWLFICANVLKQYKPPLKDPEWIWEYPDAKLYINSMF